MINEAIKKITDEMMAENDPLILMIEEHLTGICTNDRVAEKLLTEGKTIRAVRDQLYAKAKPIAEKNRAGNTGGAHISDAECLQAAEDYYGITEEDKKGGRRSSSAGIIDITDLL